MQEIIEKKELRNFGLIVGGVFCLMIWPAIRHGDGLRLWAIIPGSLLVPLGLVAPAVLAPLFKSVDEGWACHGVDQYQNYPGSPLLRAYYSDGHGYATVWLGLDAKGMEPRRRELPSCASSETTEPHDEAILESRRAVWVSF